MLFFKRKRHPIHDQLDAFCHERRHFGTTGTHRDWILQFAKVTGVRDAAEIAQADIDAFIDAVRDTRTPFTSLSALSALRIFMGHFKSRAIMAGSMNAKTGRPRNDRLRKELARKRSQGWTMPQLAAHYKRAKSTIHELLNEPRQKVRDSSKLSTVAEFGKVDHT